MANFKFVISDPATKKTYQLEIEQEKAIGLMGKKLGEKFNGDLIGLSGYELEIRGGTDKDGFPMHPQLHGSGRKKLLLAMPPCFKPKIKGQRRRKTVRGNTLSRAIVQINCKVIKTGKKSLTELLGKKEEKPAEKPEEKKQESKEKSKKEKEQKKETPKEPKKEEKKQENPEKEKKSEQTKKEPKEKPKQEKKETSKKE